MTQYLNEYEAIGKVLADLKAIVARENKRHETMQHLVPGIKELLEYEIIPMIENEIDVDPTPRFLFDESGGEPAISAEEVHHIAWVQHQAMHS